MAPLLPVSSRKAHAIGLGVAVVISFLFGMPALAPLKNREDGVALALGGRH